MDKARPQFFSRKQITSKPKNKKKFVTENWRVSVPESREDQQKGPNIIQRSDADHSQIIRGDVDVDYS